MYCRKRSTFVLALLAILLSAIPLFAQGGDHMLYGDLTLDESKASGLRALTFDVILYTETQNLVSRQTVPPNGRYRFNNLPRGVYAVVIEVENEEVARVMVDLRSPLLLDVRRDIPLQWTTPVKSNKPGFVSLSDNYQRTASIEKLFRNALKAQKKKDYAKAASFLHQAIAADPNDFQAWFELANTHFLQKNLVDAENEYLRAIDTHPGFFLALLNLGRLELSQKRYDVAMQVLQKAVKIQPESADANYFLGEAFLQAQKGSAAEVSFQEALRLDPDGMAEVHLRLAQLYIHAGLKAKAAKEYKEFLVKRPNYPDRKTLERFIAANREQEEKAKP